MHSLRALVLDRHPGQVLTLHQALNACGVFRVQVAHDLPGARRALRQPQPLNIALLDTRHDVSLLSGPRLRGPDCALVLRGEGPASALELRAREQGLWVLGLLPWQAPIHRLHALLEHYRAVVRPGQAA